LSGLWEARFEIVSGPYDGLTFVVANDGLSMESEILAVPAAQELYLRDFADVGFEVGSEGTRLNSAGDFTLNGKQVRGGQAVSDGDIVKIGATEVLLVERTCAPVSGEQGASGQKSPQEGGSDGGSEDDETAAPRKCLRPGCGAMNPPTAKWCLVCGWDLESPDAGAAT
jgi:hypothetical protein